MSFDCKNSSPSAKLAIPPVLNISVAIQNTGLNIRGILLISVSAAEEEEELPFDTIKGAVHRSVAGDAC